MWNKIAFLCVNPWESFLPLSLQSCGREYYLWIQEIWALQNVNLCCREQREIYGESKLPEGELFFSKPERELQLLYVQSGRRQVIEEVFQKSDMVIMGLPGSRKEFDKIFMAILPWKDKIKFFWDSHICRDEKYIRQLCGEYKLHSMQIFEVERSADGKLKKLPPI